MALDVEWVKTRIGDELGLSANDLAHLYGVGANALDRHLASLGKTAQAVSERILADVDSARLSHRQLEVTQEQIAALWRLLKPYRFHPFVAALLADGAAGWRLSKDDAQFVAFRTADIVGVDFEWGDVLRLRLHRLVIWPAEETPGDAQAFVDRVIKVAAYLAELSGVL
jgi:hypothetical protein